MVAQEMYQASSQSPAPASADQRLSALLTLWHNEMPIADGEKRCKIAGHILTTLFELEKYEELERFVAGLPRDLLMQLSRLQKVFVCLVSLRVFQGRFEDAFQMIEVISVSSNVPFSDPIYFTDKLPVWQIRKER